MFWAGLLGEQAYADKPEANLVRRARVELAGQQQRADDCGLYPEARWRPAPPDHVVSIEHLSCLTVHPSGPTTQRPPGCDGPERRDLRPVRLSRVSAPLRNNLRICLNAAPRSPASRSITRVPHPSACWRVRMVFPISQYNRSSSVFT